MIVVQYAKVGIVENNFVTVKPNAKNIDMQKLE